MRVNALRSFLIALIATVVSLGFPLVAGLPYYLWHGVIRGPNSHHFLGFVFFVAEKCFWLAALALLGFAIREICRRRILGGLALSIAAAFCVASPFITKVVVPPATRQAELRDLDAATVAALRSEAAALMAADIIGNGQLSPFGRIVPPEKIPATLKRLSDTKSSTGLKYGRTVAVSEDGVVMETDGFTSWRAGYMFTPLGSTTVPSHSRFITDGVFYVFTQFGSR